MSIEVRKAKTILYWQSYYPQIRVSSRVNVTQHQRKLVRTSIDLNHSGVKTVVTSKSYKIHVYMHESFGRLKDSIDGQNRLDLERISLVHASLGIVNK